jgi:ketosteroid isomerase-like protein
MSQSSLAANVTAYRTFLEQGDTLSAISQFYAEDACVFENRTLARAGRAQCLEYEREQLARQPSPPVFRFRRWALDEATATAFLEYVVRFTVEARPMRLEQVAVQQWHAAKIVEERFYYEGLVDEGD